MQDATKWKELHLLNKHHSAPNPASLLVGNVSQQTKLEDPAGRSESFIRHIATMLSVIHSATYINLNRIRVMQQSLLTLYRVSANLDRLQSSTSILVGYTHLLIALTISLGLPLAKSEIA